MRAFVVVVVVVVALRRAERAPRLGMLRSSPLTLVAFFGSLKPCTQFRPASAVPRVKPITRVDAHKGHIMCLRFGPDKLLASCSNDHSVKVWKFSAGMLRTSLSLQWTADEVHDSCVSAVEWGKGAFSNILFSSSWDRSVNMFAAKPQKVDGQAQPLCPRLIAHEARITDMDVSRSGEFLVTVSVDQSALVWRIAQNSCTPLVRCTISVTNGFPSAVSAGSSTFVTASGFGQIMQWPFPTPEYAACVCVCVCGLSCRRRC